jgi:hypothetical protein
MIWWMILLFILVACGSVELGQRSNTRVNLIRRRRVPPSRCSTNRNTSIGTVTKRRPFPIRITSVAGMDPGLDNPVIFRMWAMDRAFIHRRATRTHSNFYRRTIAEPLLDITDRGTIRPVRGLLELHSIRMNTMDISSTNGGWW